MVEQPVAQTKDRKDIISSFGDELERGMAARVLDLMDNATRTGEPALTGFLDPSQQEVARLVVQQDPSLTFMLAGGYRGAERRRLVVMPRFYLPELVDMQVTAIEARGDFRFQEASHRDFLGSLLGTGVKRDKVGDILVMNDGCQAILATEVRDFLIANWTSVQRVSFTPREIDLEELVVPLERVKEIRATVASLRLDAIASAGYGNSRTVMAREIRAGKVKVNWLTVDEPDHEVGAGAMLSVRGRGRVEVVEVAGQTKKGRISVVLKRYF